jgi:DNA-binding NarL/FixJ family response regulator
MSASAKPAVSAASLDKSPPMAALAPRLRVLFVTTSRRTGHWLAEAFAAEYATGVVLEESTGAAAGLSRLRDEAFDAVLVTHEPGELDALAFLHALRTGGSEEPVVLLGAQSEQEVAVASFEAGADAYVCVNTATARGLIHLAGRAIQRHRLLKENRRYLQGQRQRLSREHQEAEHLLAELKGMAAALKRLRTPDAKASGVAEPHGAPRLPAELFAHYRELLRAYVIMGSGNLAEEVFALAELLVASDVTACQTLELHLAVLADSVAGLGNRSSRHVMTRADLLMLELMTHLAAGYHQRYRERRSPPRQMWLPGFE